MNKTLNYIREKFFSSPIDAFLTISISYLIYLTIPPLLDWMFISATFSGESKKNVFQVEHAGYLLKFGLIDFYMECIQMMKFGE